MRFETLFVSPLVKKKKKKIYIYKSLTRFWGISAQEPCRALLVMLRDVKRCTGLLLLEVFPLCAAEGLILARHVTLHWIL